MAEEHWLRHAMRMGWFEYKHSVRSIRADTGRFVLLSAAMLFPTLLLTGLVVLFASVIRGATVEYSLGPSVRGSVAMFWLFGTFFLTQRAATAFSELVAEPFVLTTVSSRTAVVGSLVAESLRVGTYMAPIGLLVTATATYAFGSAATPLMAIAVGCLFVASAVTTGRSFGYGAAWLVARVPVIARHKGTLGGAIVLVFFGLYALVQIPSLPISVDPATLGVVPVGWLVDLLAVGTPVGWSLGHAVGGLISAGFIVATGVVLATRIASSLWFAEAVDTSTTNPTTKRGRVPTEDSDKYGALNRALGPVSVPFVSGPVRTVAEWTLFRARREPQRLNFLFVPVFGLGSALVSTLVQGDGSLAILGPAVALLSGWTVGAAFALNPFGDEGPVLPVTLIAVSGRSFVRGLVTASVLWLPVVAVLTAVSSFVGGYGLGSTFALALAGCLIAVVGALLSPAIGMWLPRYSAIRIGSSDEVRPPRLVAGILHFTLVCLPGVPLVWSAAGSFSPLRVALGTGLALGGIVTGSLAYVVAVRRFERYEP